MDTQVSLEGMAEIQAMFAQAPAITAKHLRIATHKSTALLLREVVEATPTGAHQLLRKSIFQDVQVSESGFLGVVGTASPYAIPVELGTKPHFPPIEPLIDWVKAKLPIGQVMSISTHRRMNARSLDATARSVAYAVALKISKKGTEGAFMFRDTMNRQQATVNGYFLQARQDIVAEMIATGRA